MNVCLVDFDSELFFADLLWGSADPYGVYLHLYLEIGYSDCMHSISSLDLVIYELWLIEIVFLVCILVCILSCGLLLCPWLVFMCLSF